jgi:Uncharacterized protein conserved in bacteria (DUF2252)
MQRRVLATRIVLAMCLVLTSAACRSRQLRADPKVLAAAPPDLQDRVRADPYNYFRLINQEWTARVCDSFAGDLPGLPVVQLHGDAHVEQYALTNDAWGLDDFDDSARGPALVDIVRFLGSIELAVRRRGWSRERDRMFDRFLAGYRRGLSDPSYQPPEPDIVRVLRAQTPVPTNEAFLEWAEAKMEPIPPAQMKAVIAAMAVFTEVVRQEQPDLPDGYFNVLHAGWLHMGVGSAASRKILMRVRGPSSDPADDEILEAKAIRTLNGLRCLEAPRVRPTIRVIVGSQQLGRLKHHILAAAPEVNIPEMTIGNQHLRNWWLRSWEPSYREIALDDLRSVEDLAGIVYDSGVQLGAGSTHGATRPEEAALRTQSLTSLSTLEPRLRREAEDLVEEMLRAWNEFRGS